MWITKLKLKHADCPIVTRCERFKTIVLSYPSTWYEKGEKRFATTTCFFSDASSDVQQALIDDLRSDKRITNVERSGDIFSYEIALDAQGEHVMLYHRKQIIFVKPTINHFDGHEYWEVASWKKEELERFVQELKRHMDVCVVLKIERSVLTDVYFPNVMPKLSSHQKTALKLAYRNGYYEYPRKITVKELASLAGVSISTFQEHLRKAELKLLPAVIEYYIAGAKPK